MCLEGGKKRAFSSTRKGTHKFDDNFESTWIIDWAVRELSVVCAAACGGPRVTEVYGFWSIASFSDSFRIARCLMQPFCAFIMWAGLLLPSIFGAEVKMYMYMRSSYFFSFILLSNDMTWPLVGNDTNLVLFSLFFPRESSRWATASEEDEIPSQKELMNESDDEEI